jgi:hypothetical protein
MCSVVRKRSKHRTPPTPSPRCSATRRQHYLKNLSIRAYRTKIRSNCPLSDSKSNAQEFLVDVPLTKFNFFDACYDTNMATDTCFGTLQHSIRKKIWSLHNMWQATVKWVDNFYKIDFKRFFQYLNFCNKTYKCTRIKGVLSHIIYYQHILHKYIFGFVM